MRRFTFLTLKIPNLNAVVTVPENNEIKGLNFPRKK